MKQEDIQNGNRLIAEFMGMKNIKDLRPDIITRDMWTEGLYDAKKTWYALTYHRSPLDPAYGVWDELYYHTSWDWLMPVVDKIESSDNGAGVRLETRLSAHIKVNAKDGFSPIYCYTFGITFNQHEKFSIDAESKIAAVWHCVVQFIHWYTHQPK